MRTTITLPDELVEEAVRITGAKRTSEAITRSLEDYLGLKKRLALLDALFTAPVPHDRKAVKSQRRHRQWSS